MNRICVRACAKINLTLDIVGAVGGFHAIDSLAVTVSLADRVCVRRRRDERIVVRMRGEGSEGIPPQQNNAVRAARAFAARFHTGGAEITIVKRIPVGAGLGGSSADAAGVLRAMAGLYGIGDAAALKTIADELGSDTGYLLTGGLARLTGRGEQVQALAQPLPLYVLLLIPAGGVSTAACYAAYDDMGAVCTPCTQRVCAALAAGETAAAAAAMQNALTMPAMRLNGDVEKALRQLRAFQSLGAGMTGSGSACFALFATRAQCLRARRRVAGAWRALCVRTTERVALPGETKHEAGVRVRRGEKRRRHGRTYHR